MPDREGNDLSTEQMAHLLWDEDSPRNSSEKTSKRLKSEPLFPLELTAAPSTHTQATRPDWKKI